jgi:hypothetical protein
MSNVKLGAPFVLATQLEFSYYRTIDKSEVDLIDEGSFGTVPIEIKHNTTVKRRDLRSLENFLADTGSAYGIMINRGKRPELLADNIVQIPVNYL